MQLGARLKLGKWSSSLFYFSLAFVFLFLWLLVEWPGILNSDSMMDWRKAELGTISYWRSYLYSLYLKFIFWTGGSPLLVVFLQISMISWIFSSIAKKFHVLVPWATFGFAFLLFLTPLNGQFGVFAIRDVISAWLTVWVAIDLFFILVQKRQMTSLKFFFKGILICGLLPALRMENILIPLLFSSILIYYFRQNVELCVAIGISTVSSVLLFLVVIPFAFGVEVEKIFYFSATPQAIRYQNTSLLSPVRHILKNMDLKELGEVSWGSFERILPREVLLGPESSLVINSSLQAMKEDSTLGEEIDFRKAAWELISLHPLLFLQNRALMFAAATGISEGTYYFHDEEGKEILHSSFQDMSARARSIFYEWRLRLSLASMLLPFLLALSAILFAKRCPMTAVTVFFISHRWLILFFTIPAPHFSYFYANFVFSFFIPLLWFFEQRSSMLKQNC